MIPTFAGAVPCAQFKVPVPEPVGEAAAFDKAAATALAEIRAENPPDLDGATSKSVSKTIGAAAAWSTHPARLAAAEALVRQVPGRLSQAWGSRVVVLESAFAQPFDDALARFGAAVDALAGIIESTPAVAMTLATGEHINPARAIEAGLGDEYTAYVTAVADLGLLLKLRNMFATVLKADVGQSSGGVQTSFEQLSRIGTVADKETAVNLGYIVGDAAFGEADWWLRLYRHPKITLGWTTAQNQISWTKLPLGKAA